MDAIRAAPLAWAGALGIAAIPFAVMVFKPSSSSGVPTAAQTPASTSTVADSQSSAESWFGGADNPFLTEEQSRQQRVRSAVMRVEQVLRRRADVRDVTVIASNQSLDRTDAWQAVVTIHMRQGSVPVALVDATGTLLTAAIPGLKPQAVTVIDESTGLRARPIALDDTEAAAGRTALAEATAQAKLHPIPVAPAVSIASRNSVSGDTSPMWFGIAAFGAAAAIGVAVFWIRVRRLPQQLPSQVDEDSIPGTLSIALHRSVAERSALISTALVERLEQQGASAHEVAQLLLSLEPWAAERLLKGMPPASLAKVEDALRDPSSDAPVASVRALAEAVLMVQAAA